MKAIIIRCPQRPDFIGNVVITSVSPIKFKGPSGVEEPLYQTTPKKLNNDGHTILFFSRDLVPLPPEEDVTIHDYEAMCDEINRVLAANRALRGERI